jgi:5'-nucleotidase
MHLLLTNDDGIDAPGLAALAQVAAQFGRVTVVAPDGHISGCSHGTTTDRPLSVEERGPGRYAVLGTPADCARIGTMHLAPDADWVLSGINDGGNLGVDVYMSGTVAAAREAMLLGRPAIALSQYRRGRSLDWSRAANLVAAILPQLLETPPEWGVFFNVNLPDDGESTDTPLLVERPLDPHPLPITFKVDGQRYVYHSNYHERPREPDCDVAACFGGQITLTRMTHFGSLPPRR